MREQGRTWPFAVYYSVLAGRPCLDRQMRGMRRFEFKVLAMVRDIGGENLREQR